MIALGFVCALVLAAPAETVQDAAVRRAREAVRSRLGVADERIQLETVGVARWTDTSLGCPEKGQSYQPVVSDGYVVRLRVDDRSFDVHVSEGRAFLCDGPGGSPGALALAAARLSKLARADLAARLKRPEAEIRIERVRPLLPSDGESACRPAPASASAAAKTAAGFLIRLSSAGVTYDYRSDLEAVIPCPAATPGP